MNPIVEGYYADLEHWEKHPNIIDMSGYPYIHRAVWAPTIIEKNGKYYLIFASNDIQSDDEIGGLEIAVSDSPTGPFVNHIGKTLIDRFINYAQPIDAHLFKDDKLQFNFDEMLQITMT